MSSPFKFLDSYTKEDGDIFFGRERETEELYHRVFESKILLVYGVSGTGKSSLVQCGLANKFNSADWLPVNVRRAGDIVQSMASAIRQKALTPLSGTIETPARFRKAVRSLYLDHYKPIFFIFDQFEELFIFGNPSEKKEFAAVIKTLAESDLQCRFIFVMRKEYLADVSGFEKVIPSFMDNRVNVERMTIANARQAIEGPCRVAGIDVEDGFAGKMLEKLSPGSAEVELTYLQVFLDRLYRLAGEEAGGNSPRFHSGLLEKAGNVSDLLGSFLDEQIDLLSDPETTLAVLKSFVSVKGTKRQMTPGEISDYAQTLGRPIDESALQELIQTLIQLRILRDKDQNDRYELRHDALATKIFEKITLVEKELLEIRHLIENAYNSWEKRGVLLSADDLDYIAPYESRLYLSRELDELLEKSKRSLARAKRRNRVIAFAAMAALLIVFAGFTWWAMVERKVATENFIKARVNNFLFLSQKVAETDPTAALRLAEYAHSLDPGSRDIYQNLNRIYYDNNFYRIIFRDDISSMAVSPDGERILTGHPDGRFKIRDIQGNIILTVRAHEKFVNSVGFSYDGGLIITGSDDNTARIFDSEGNLLQILAGHDDYVISAAFSPDGTHVITASDDNTARLWNLGGNLLQALTGHQHPVNAALFSPDGNYILTGSTDNTARLWDLNGNLLKVLTGHEGPISAAKFSPDGKHILTGSWDRTARLWDLDGNVLLVYSGHGDFVESVSFSPVGNLVLTGSRDKMAKIWDMEGNLVHVFPGHDKWLKSVVFSPDGKSIYTVSYDQTLRQWEIPADVPREFRINEYADDSGFEGKFIAMRSLSGDIGLSVASVSFSPDGKKILTGSWDNTARLWDLQGNLLQVFKGAEHEESIRWLSNNYPVIFSPDGNQILTGSMDNTLQMWDLQGNLLNIFTGHQSYVNSAAFSPDCKQILTSSYDIRLWDLKGNVLKEFKGHNDFVTSAAFSPDGKYIISGSWDWTARLWDINGNPLRTYPCNAVVFSAVFSPCGKYVLAALGDETARIWDLQGNLLQVFSGHQAPVYSANFSPDGNNILTGSGDRTARIWDLQGNTLQIFTGHNNTVLSAAFSPDGIYILTGSEDQTARLWQVRELYELFNKRNAYEQLSIGQKIEYGILKFMDVQKLTDEEDIFRAAGYYKNAAGLGSIEQRDDNLNYALVLFGKLNRLHNKADYITGMIGIYKTLDEIAPSDKNRKESEKLFGRLLSINDPEELQKGAVFFFTRARNYTDRETSIKYYSQCILLYEEILTRFPETDVTDDASTAFNNISLDLLFESRFEEALDMAEKGLALKEEDIIFTKLALALLYNNRIDEAIGVVAEYLDAEVHNMSFKDYIMNKMTELEEAGIVLPDHEKVRERIKDI